MSQYSSKEVEHIITEARKAERERCAKLAEAQNAYCFDESTEECQGGKCDAAMANAIAKKIRELT